MTTPGITQLVGSQCIATIILALGVIKPTDMSLFLGRSILIPLELGQAWEVSYSPTCMGTAIVQQAQQSERG